MLAFLQDAQETACWLGAAAFLGYGLLFVFGLQQPPAGASAGSKAGEEPQVRPRTSQARSVAAVAAAVLVASAAWLLAGRPGASGGECPWKLGDSGALPAARPTTQSGTAAPEALRLATEACGDWPLQAPGASGLPEEQPTASALHAHLACLSSIGMATGTGCEAARILLERGRQLLPALVLSAGSGDEGEKLLRLGRVESGRLARTVLARCCGSVTTQLQATRRVPEGATPSVPRALVAVGELLELESRLADARATVTEGLEFLSGLAENGDWEAADEVVELKTARSASRACLLGAVREARLLAAALPAGSESLRSASACGQPHFAAIEARALQEASSDSDGAAQFGLGLYWSEVAVAGRKAALFGDGPPGGSEWRRDIQGFYVPEDFERAEAFLLKGEMAAVGPARGDRGAVRALRLYHHAKELALRNHDGAAEWRFQASARLAASHRRQKLAAHSLTRLSHFALLRSRRQEALGFASDALRHHKASPFAQYLQATLRRVLGELRSPEDVQHAEQQLVAAAGQLPSDQLEEHRAAVLAELVLWREADASWPRACVELADVAKVLLCVLVRLVLP